MSSLESSRVLLCTLGVIVALTLGCRQSAQNDRAPADPGGTGRVSDSATDDVNAADAEAGSAAPGAAEGTEDAATLGIGDPAPPLAIDQWVTGEPIESLEKGQVYVVEFWATWCPPCRTSMPHLSQLQQQYGDQVQFIGVTREDRAVVDGFLEKEQSPGETWRDVVKYRLAIDAGDATHAAYMQAAGQGGIPTAFIVGRDRVIDWIGHPMAMDEPLAAIVAGNWDRQAAVGQFRQQRALKQVMGQLGGMMREGQWDQALDLLEQVETQSGSSAQVSKLKLSILRRAGRTQEASEMEVKLVEQAWDDAGELNEIAWSIATGNGDRDLPLAQKAAVRASELRNHTDATILDTLARVYYEQGQLDEAIQWQRKAAEHNRGNAEIDETLKMYEAEQAARSPASDPQPKVEPGSAGDAT